MSAELPQATQPETAESPASPSVVRVAVNLLRLCRLYYGLPLGFTLGLTIVYARDGRMADAWPATVAASLALAMVVAAGYVFNDVCDCRVDRINAPTRPIVDGRVPAGIALLWAVLLTFAGLTVAMVWCRIAFAAGLAVVAGGLACYDLTSKRLGVGKQLLVAALMTSLYPLAIAQAGGAFGGRATSLLFFPIWLFVTSFGYEILKDIRDRHGDVAGGRRQDWIARDSSRARRIASAAILIGAGVLIAPCFAGCGRPYATIIPAAILAGVVATRLPIRPALGAVYVECVLVGLAATADVLT